MDVGEAIRTLRAVRHIAVHLLPGRVAGDTRHAGRQTQSCKNTQPWSFIAIRERECLPALSKLGPYAGHLADAALGIAILTPDPSLRWSVLFGAGPAAATMQPVAWGHGGVSSLAALHQPDSARKLPGCQADMHLRPAVSFGYPERPEFLHTPPLSAGAVSRLKPTSTTIVGSGVE